MQDLPGCGERETPSRFTAPVFANNLFLSFYLPLLIL
jgi:hypothetical protein